MSAKCRPGSPDNTIPQHQNHIAVTLLHQLPENKQSRSVLALSTKASFVFWAATQEEYEERKVHILKTTDACTILLKVTLTLSTGGQIDSAREEELGQWHLLQGTEAWRSLSSRQPKSFFFISHCLPIQRLHSPALSSHLPAHLHSAKKKPTSSLAETYSCRNTVVLSLLWAFA